MRKIINIFIITLIIMAAALPVTAEIIASDDQNPGSADEAAASEEKAEELTLPAAQNMALENNMQTLIDDLEIRSKEKALEKAIENAAMAGDAFGAETVLNNRIRKEVRVMEAETALETARMTRADHNEQLKLDVSRSFYNILLARKELEKETRKLEILKEKYEIAKKKYEAKSITLDELDAAEYDVFSKTSDVESVNQKLKSLDISLKEQLGLSFDGEPINVAGDIVQINFTEADINKIVEERLNNAASVYSAAGRYEAAKRIFEITEEIFKPDTEIYDRNRISLEKAAREYEAAKRDREVNIRNSYNEILNMRDSIEMAVRYEELQKKKLDNTKIRYDKGQIGKEVCLTAEMSYLDAVYSRYKAVCDFNIKYESFLNLIRSE